MSGENKFLKIILALEVGLACLILALVVVWQAAPELVLAAPGLVLATPDETPTPTATLFLVTVSANASPTPFLPEPGQTPNWGPGQNPPVMASLQPLPTLSKVANLPLPPSPVPEIIPTPAQLGEFGPLSYPEQMLLYSVSLHYVAPTVPEALRLAQELNFVGQNSHPSNMCGPLSIAILREAGLVNPETHLESFWLLNPRKPNAQKLLTQTFPAERFEHLVTKTALNKIDWTTTELQPGDFLYLYAGLGGNFEHMLVVSRVDGLHRAFAVTNYATESGFVIQEKMLYDPSDPSAGLFAEWTKRPYAMLGSTGYGGFELWRLRQPERPGEAW